VRKTTIATVVVLVLVAVGVWVVLARPFSGEVGLLRDMSQSFMEDLQFKDFRSSKLYSHELDQHRLDIGATLERLFLIKPEFLDILDFKLVRTDIDASGDRAKVLVRVRFKKLNLKKEVEEAEIVLYWIKRHPDCPLGGSCPAGQCIAENGETMRKPDDDHKKRHENEGRTGGAADVVVKSEDAYACDATVEKRWFMNLDSTLKEKPLQ